MTNKWQNSGAAKRYNLCSLHSTFRSSHRISRYQLNISAHLFSGGREDLINNKSLLKAKLLM